MITQKRLKEILRYNEHTGQFIRLIAFSNNSVVGEEVGSITADGYRVVEIDGKLYRLHRLAFLYMDGYLPGNNVDHINGVRHDNRWSNLRHVSRQCNSRNSGLRKDNNSGIKGVSWYPSCSKYRVKIMVNQKHIHCGYFTNLDSAVRARWEAEMKYNYPDCDTTSSSYEYLKFRGLL